MNHIRYSNVLNICLIDSVPYESYCDSVLSNIDSLLYESYFVWVSFIKCWLTVLWIILCHTQYGQMLIQCLMNHIVSESVSSNVDSLSYESYCVRLSIISESDSESLKYWPCEFYRNTACVSWRIWHTTSDSTLKMNNLHLNPFVFPGRILNKFQLTIMNRIKLTQWLSNQLKSQQTD